MKIALVVSSLEMGGAERVASVLSRAWTERGDEVTLIATYSERGGCFFPISEGVSVVYLADRLGAAGRRRMGYFAKIAALREVFRESKPDVIVSFLTNVNVTSILASLRMKIPLVACEHNDPSADGRSVLWKILCALLYPRADALTFLSESIASTFTSRTSRTPALVTVVPNPVPEEVLEVQRTGRDDGRKRLISVGRLNPQKQYGLLIETFSQIAQEFGDWDLWIWGEGPERGLLEARIVELNLQGRVFLPGSTRDAWYQMASSDAFVLSSRFEGMPMALMEAMAIGLPAVSFDCRSGPRELTNNGNDGLLIPPDDVPALASALRSILADNVLRDQLGERGARSIRERYSVPAILAIWDQLFSRVRAF